MQASLRSKAQGLPKGIQLMLLFADSVLRYALESQLEFSQSVRLLLHGSDEPFGSRRGRLDRGMHHHIHDTDITRMTYTRNNRQREIGTVESQ